MSQMVMGSNLSGGKIFFFIKYLLPVFQTFFKKFEVPASASLVERTELDDVALDIVGRDET